MQYAANVSLLLLLGIVAFKFRQARRREDDKATTLLFIAGFFGIWLLFFIADIDPRNPTEWAYGPLSFIGGVLLAKYVPSLATVGGFSLAVTPLLFAPEATMERLFARDSWKPVQAIVSPDGHYVATIWTGDEVDSIGIHASWDRLNLLGSDTIGEFSISGGVDASWRAPHTLVLSGYGLKGAGLRWGDVDVKFRDTTGDGK